MTLRPYQLRAVESVEACLAAGGRPCLIAPTGAGKTRMGVALIQRYMRDGARVLWVAHRRELLDQAASNLRANGLPYVGIISPAHDADPHAPVQVASIQTLAARTTRPAADLVIYDEAHHYVAASWNAVAEHYSVALSVGLTATPQRRDGRPLGDMFSHLIVAAQYSDLLRDGHLVPCRVFRPTENLGRDLAQDPVVAYQRHASGHRAFCFVATVELAYDHAEAFRAAGIPAGTIEADTAPADRAELLRRFRAGDVLVLTNVFALTEGVDVPEAVACILARNIGHAGSYLQMVGRVLRPAPGKTEAILIDLSGASHAHGLPTADREYSLDGRPIRVVGEPLKNCPSCGACIPVASNPCPQCNFEFPRAHTAGPKIYDLALAEVYAGAETPDNAKRREWDRLLGVARSRDYSIGWAIREWRKLFNGPAPYASELPEDERRAEFNRLAAMAADRGYKPGFAAVRYKESFGTWPPRHWNVR